MRFNPAQATCQKVRQRTIPYKPALMSSFIILRACQDV